MKTYRNPSFISFIIICCTFTQTLFAQNRLQNRLATDALRQRIFEAFKDDVSLLESNQAVFRSPTEIKIIKETQVFITYISEETSGKGTLAYFTYKTGTQPSVEAKNNLAIIFQRLNSSVLEYGDMVNLGDFKPGTSIGFVFVPNGWTGNEVKLSGTKLYTTDYSKIAATAYDSETGMVILGIEQDVDIPVKDLNDILIGIHTSDKSALKTQSLAPLSTAPNTNTREPESGPQKTSNYYTCFDKGMTEAYYQNSLKTLRNTSDDVNKINIIKSTVNAYKITPEQAKEYCLTLANYSYRCEMAKYLYNYECEKDRASILAEVISNTNFEQDYLNFIKEQDALAKAPANPSPVTNPNTSSNNTVIIVDPNAGYGRPQYPYNYAAGVPMTQRELSQLLSQLASLSFDSYRENMIKVAITGRSLSVAQVRPILSQFDFDHYRLNIAKYLYDFTYDRHNYYTLSSSFQFLGTQRDFMTFLRNR